ncbi:MAG: hypothetical protein LC802_16560 [Acidobacteria bacterium]|nr:hypothetical protein [Acidobacteriota bacterium]
MRQKLPDTDSVVRDGHEVESCEFHGLELEKDSVEIVYGLLPFDEEKMEACRNFPHANTWVGGGCLISSDNPERVEVLYCRACRAAEEEWEAARRALQAVELPLRDESEWVN